MRLERVRGWSWKERSRIGEGCFRVKRQVCKIIAKGLKIRARVVEEVAGGSFLLFSYSNLPLIPMPHATTTDHIAKPSPWPIDPSLGRWGECRMSYAFSSHCLLPLAPPQCCLPWDWCRIMIRALERRGGEQNLFLVKGSPVIWGNLGLPKPLREVVCQGGGPPAQSTVWKMGMPKTASYIHDWLKRIHLNLKLFITNFTALSCLEFYIHTVTGLEISLSWVLHFPKISKE